MRSPLRALFELGLPVTLVALLAASACGGGSAVKKVPGMGTGATAGDAGEGGAPTTGGDGGGRASTTGGRSGAGGRGGADAGGTGGDSGADSAGSDSGGDAGALGMAGAAGAGDDALPTIASTVKATTAVDRTGQEFGMPTPDTVDDATVLATIDGAFDALLWVSTDAQGAADMTSHEWDTVVGPEPLPEIGTSFTVGSETWTLAVLDGTTLVNDSTGHAALPAGTHDLTLSVAATAKMVTGQHFRIYARHGSTWVAGPVFVW